MAPARQATLAIAILLTSSLAASAAGCSGDDTNAPAATPDAGDAAPDGTTHADGSVEGSTPDGADGAAPPDATSPGDDGASDAGLADASDATDSATADAGPTGKLRVAWFDDPAYVPALAAARFDVCVAAHGTGTWQGPLLAAFGAAGLELGDVSAYFNLPVGRYDVRLVSIASDAGPPTCEASDAGASDGGSPTDFTNLPAISVGAEATFVVTPPFTNTAAGAIADVVPFIDETTTDAGKVAMRFANVSGPANASPLDYGLGGGVTFMPLFTGVSSTAHLDPAADVNGYLQVDPFAQLDTTLQQGGTDLGVSDGIDAPAGTRISAFAVLAKLGSGALAAGLVACEDDALNAAAPLLSKCNPISVFTATAPSGAQTRFADFLADPSFPNVNICLRYTGATSFGLPLLGPNPDGGVAGLTAGQVTKRFSVHSSFPYDVRLVAAGSTTCDSAVTPDVHYEPLTDDPVTLALTGFDAEPEDAGYTFPDAGPDGGPGLTSLRFTAQPIPDLGCNAAVPFVRAVHMAGGAPAPQTVTFSGGSGFTFTNVPYGTFLTDPVVANECGYAHIASPGAGEVSVAGGLWIYTPTATTTDTLYLFSSGGLVKVAACNDSDPSASACTMLPAGP